MQVTLKPEPVFTVCLGDNSIQSMRQTDAWKGFIELTAADGVSRLYILDPRSMANRGPWDKVGIVDVVSGTPELLARLHRTAGDKATTS